MLQHFKCPSTDENDVFERESRAGGHLLLGTWNFFSVFRCGRTQLPVVPVRGHSLLIQWLVLVQRGGLELLPCYTYIRVPFARHTQLFPSIVLE